MDELPIVVPVAIKHTATATGLEGTYFRCEKCGYSASAVVLAENVATRTSPLGIGSKADARDAQEEALRGLNAEARRLAQSVVCPSCAHRSLAARSRLFRRALRRSAPLSVPLVGGLIGLLAADAAPAVLGGAAGVSILAAMLLAAAVLFLYRRSLRHLDACVVLAPGAIVPDTPQVVGRPCAVCGKKIVMATEAKTCANCRAILHEDCSAAHRCGAGSPA